MCTRIFACSFAVLAAAVTADDDVAIGSLPPTMSCILGNGISPLNRFSCGQRLDVVANAVAGTTGLYPSADDFRLTRESSLSSITEDGKLRGNGNTVSLYSNSSLFLFYFFKVACSSHPRGCCVFLPFFFFFFIIYHSNQWPSCFR